MTHFLFSVLCFLIAVGGAGILYGLRVAGRPCKVCQRPWMDCPGHGPHENPDAPDPDFVATVLAGHLESPDQWADRTGTNRTTPVRTEGTDK